MSVNHEFFKEINTEEKAYWLGFLYADGHIERMTENSHRISILLGKEDYEHLENLKSVLGISNKVSVRDQLDKRSGKYYGRAHLRFTNKQMISDLVNLNFQYKKSERVDPPNISKDMEKYFIRGYIDGDGWIRKDRGLIGFACVSERLNEYICKHLEESCGVNIKTINEGLRYGKPFFNSNVNKKSESHKVLTYLYSDATVFLQRKMTIAKEFMIS